MAKRQANHVCDTIKFAHQNLNVIDLSLHSKLPYVAKYRRGNILANDSQFAKILPIQNLPLKYVEYRAEAICQFITTKSLVSIHLSKCHPFNVLRCMVFRMYCVMYRS